MSSWLWGIVMDVGREHDREAIAIVSCDILGHSTAPHDIQVARVAAINEIIAETIHSCPPGDVVWSSGGDGGHVVFRQQCWQQPAVRVIIDLCNWSAMENVLLRITGHYGKVSHIRGADGRVQFVGQGINYAGWLLRQVTLEGVVVSESFCERMKGVTVEPAVRFHDPRPIPNIKFEPRLHYLMSADGVESAWVQEDDRPALTTASDAGAGWDVLYYVKRIWQANVDDQDAVRALEDVGPYRLRSRGSVATTDNVNAFLGTLQSDELKEVIKLGQLVERRRGEAICRYDDLGNTMFVILRGQVGIFNSEGKGFGGTADPKHIQQRGEIVGELAYALERNRTADLMALTDVALLSFNYDDLELNLANKRVGDAARKRLSDFINYRVLQHVCDNASYLLGDQRNGPLSVGVQSWRDALTKLRQDCELLVMDTTVLDLTLDSVPPSGTGSRGLCILATGKLRMRDRDSLHLDGADFPVLWVDVPTLLPQYGQAYSVEEEPVKILRIATEGINRLAPRQREALRLALPKEVKRRSEGYKFDVFICHSARDKGVVIKILERLRDAGIKYWYDDDQLKPGMPVTETIEDGLVSSRFVLACISANLVESPWGRRELDARLHVDIKRRSKGSILLLMLNEGDNKDEVIPLLLRDAKRVVYTRGREFENLIEYLAGDPVQG